MFFEADKFSSSCAELSRRCIFGSLVEPNWQDGLPEQPCSDAIEIQKHESPEEDMDSADVPDILVSVEPPVNEDGESAIADAGDALCAIPEVSSHLQASQSLRVAIEAEYVNHPLSPQTACCSWSRSCFQQPLS